MNDFIRQFFCLVAISLILGGIVLFSLPSSAQIEPTSYADSDLPIILPRSTWDNSPSLNALMTWVPQQVQSDGTPSDWQPVERIILHDTGCDPISNPTCNNNTDPILTIQAIYRFHAVTRGWGDIGYNYIIDQQGRIYEGRYGGNGSRGGHTYYDRTYDNFNFGSIGITILGNYATWQPPSAVYDSLAKLIGWLTVNNNLDPQGQSSSFIWNASKGGFKTFFSGPVVLGHKDVEAGNPDPALLDFARVRREAAVFAAKFKDYIYQKNDGSAKVYKIISGTRKTFENLANYLAQGNAYSKLVSLPAKQLDLFSETRFLKYPDGSLVQIKGQPDVYLIEGGKKRVFNLTAKQFVKLGFDFSQVRQVTADELLNYPDSFPIKYGPDGQLISDGTKVYFIQNGKRRWVTSGNLFNILGYKWSKVTNMEPVQVAAFLGGSAMLYPDGTLFREQGKPEVYLMKGGQKHEFVSAQSFIKLGYKWEKVITLEPVEVALAPTGSIMTYADGTLVQAENDPDIFLIEKGAVRLFISAEIFLNLKYKWSQVLAISAQELARYQQGEPVKYSEGTLLRPNDRNDVYLISGGKPVPVDSATFKKKKYKWVNVSVVSAQDFGILYEGKSIVSVSPAIPQSSPTPRPEGEARPEGAAAPTPTVLPSPSATPTATPTPSPVASPSPTPGSAAVPKVRIAIFEVTAPSVTLTANTAFDILDKAGGIIVSKNAGENFVYTINSASTAFAKIAPRSGEGVVEIVSYQDNPAWKPTLNYNKFRGAIEIVYSAKSNKVWAVNELGLEDYLKGIAETLQGDPAEYQKAMTVAARTYAYYYILKGGKRGADEVYHLNNTTSDQLYKGYNREILAPSVVDGVNATPGEIAAYNGQPIVAAYSSGAPELIIIGTKAACAVWGDKFCQPGFEYLAGGAKDPTGTQYTQTVCGGANHCVGLSGAGTRQFAKTGVKAYQEILKHYYIGVEIKKIY
ncbi:N-acetylmuramoyl-L-alanine amidase [Patescibacteria group bacterium]|nr:N-acetylmuramoyl-L-alanine amidase [Patescibacteria group bacterium]